jgi:hypothetical protein
MTTSAPRFEFDPSTVVASIEVFPKQEYEFQVGEPKAFKRTAGEGDKEHDSFGVRFPLIIKRPDEYDGKRTVFSIYLQSEGGKAMGKGFMMACMGFKRGTDGEKAYDAEARGKDWGLDFETGGVGDAWRDHTGKRVIGSLDVTKNNKTGDPMQQFQSWRPITSGDINQ